MSPTTQGLRRKNNDSPSHEEIAALAYQLWMARGCEEGAPDEDWFEMERELGVVNGIQTT